MRPQFQRPVDLAVFTARDYLVEFVLRTDPVAVATTETVTFTPPVGYFCYMRQIRIYIGLGPTGATTGYQYLDVYTTGAGNGVSYLYARYDWNQGASFLRGAFRGTTSLTQPTSEDAQAYQQGQLAWDADNPLVISYQNSTDQPQVVPRQYTIAYERIRSSQ